MIKGLFIKEPWISLILDGSKTWEIRSCNTKIRGRIALISSGTGEVKGYVDISDAFKISKEMFKSSFNMHRINSQNTIYKKPHVWVLTKPHKLEKGIPFQHKKGCVVWINLTDTYIIEKSLLN
jgi:hypothetical protein